MKLQKKFALYLENLDKAYFRWKTKIKLTTNVLSTAEAISLLANSMALAGSFGDGEISDYDLAAGLQGAIVKEDSKDGQIWTEYLENIMKKEVLNG